MNRAVQIKSFRFAIRIVKLNQHLHEKKREYVMSKQVLRSGTSIGANVAEAQQAHSKADFVAKLTTALKETTETKYWIRLLAATEYLTKQEFDSLYTDCTELEKLLVTIIKTSRT